MSKILKSLYSDVDKTINQFAKQDSEHWMKLGRQQALRVFHYAAETVPAYKKFLKEHKVSPTKIKTISDFEKLPIIDKKNYLSQYPLNELVPGGDLSKMTMVSRSSGSSGNPFYWPRSEEQELEVAFAYENVFRSMFSMHKKSTLLIIGYGMGTWVAGTFTLSTSTEFALKGNPLTIVTPGTKKEETVELVRNLGQHYDQVVLCGYPPFVKEVIDTGLSHKLDWKKYNMKFVFGAEAFSEEYRDYFIDVIGSDQPLLDTMNTVGSADAAILAHETPLSIAVRRAIFENPKLRDELIYPNRVPTLGQYYPFIKWFEQLEDELVFTSNNGIPLVRYNIHDSGRLIPYDEMKEHLDYHGVDTTLLLKDAASEYPLDWKLPFFAIYGKSDNTVKFYGANVYPENIKIALEKKNVASKVSGKFTFEVTHDHNKSQVMHIHVELAPDAKPSVAFMRDLQDAMLETLIENNSEFANSYRDVGVKAAPRVELVPFGEEMFQVDIKHNYAKKGKK